MAETVTVACKLPSGIVLDIRGELRITNGPDGVASASAPVLKTVTLAGSAAQRRLEKDGDVTGEVGHVVEGYGLTQVDKDFWDTWLKQNEGNRLLDQMILFAIPKLEEAKKEARAISKDVKTGLEPINPNGDTRLGRGVTKAETLAA